MKFLKYLEEFDLFKYGNYTDPDEIQKINIGDKLLCVYSNYDVFNFGKFYTVNVMTKNKRTFNIADNNNHKRFFTYNEEDHVLYRRNTGESQLTILTTDKSIKDYIERMELGDATRKYNL